MGEALILHKKCSRCGFKSPHLATSFTRTPGYLHLIYLCLWCHKYSFFSNELEGPDEQEENKGM